VLGRFAREAAAVDAAEALETDIEPEADVTLEPLPQPTR
jgi:hypothetical protein